MQRIMATLKEMSLKCDHNLKPRLDKIAGIGKTFKNWKFEIAGESLQDLWYAQIFPQVNPHGSNIL